MSAVLSLLQSRLLRPVFVTLGIALLVQVLVAVALTRSTVTALEADLGNRLGIDSQKLSGELAQAGKEVTSSLDNLSSSTRQRLTALSLFAATLLTYPLLGLAQGSLAGWPVVVVYLFGVWAGVIVLAALIAESRGR